MPAQVKFGVMRMVKFLLTICIVLHWLACGMAFIGHLDPTAETNWIVGMGLRPADDMVVYGAALEWSMQVGAR